MGIAQNFNTDFYPVAGTAFARRLPPLLGLSAELSGWVDTGQGIPSYLRSLCA